MNPSGRRLFLAGTIGLFLFGGLHSLAVLNAYFGPHEKPEEKAFLTAAREFSEPMGPFRPTGLDALLLLNLSFSILMLQCAALSFAAWRLAREARLLRFMSAINAVALGTMTVASYLHHVPPPLVIGAITLLLFCGAWWNLKAVRLS